MVFSFHSYAAGQEKGEGKGVGIQESSGGRNQPTRVPGQDAPFSAQR